VPVFEKPIERELLEEMFDRDQAFERDESHSARAGSGRVRLMSRT
jgi:hypothetical protein